MEKKVGSWNGQAAEIKQQEKLRENDLNYAVSFVHKVYMTSYYIVVKGKLDGKLVLSTFNQL